MRKKMLTVAILLSLLALPISFWLQYQILARVNASELMWFLYWVNVPLAIMINAVSKILNDKE